MINKPQVITYNHSQTSSGQGFRKDQDQEKTKIPRVTDEGWNSQKQLSGPVEQKKKEKKKLQDLYLHPKLSPDLVPYRLFYRVGI